MEQNRPINDMMKTTIEKVRDLVDANTIVGEPIKTGDITLIPISKLSFGFATGGAEAPLNKAPEKDNSYGGASGAGVKVTPVAFIVVNGESVKMLPMSAPADTTMDRLVDKVPDLLEKLTDFFEKKSDDSQDKE